MKLFTKETLTHPSLYQLKVTHGTEGNWRAGEGGERVFLYFGLFGFGFFSWMCFSSQILQGRQKPASQRESSEAGRLQVSTLNKRHTGKLPHLSESRKRTAQPSPGHRHYTRQCWNWNNTLIPFKFVSFFFSSFFFLSPRKEKSKLKYKIQKQTNKQQPI